MMLREGAFTSFKDNITVFIDNFADDGSVHGILVSDSKKAGEKVVTVAESGRLEYTVAGPKILLKNGTRQTINKKNGQFSSMKFDDYVVDFGDISVSRKKSKGVREWSIIDLLREADNPNVPPKQARAYRTEAHRRILAPFFNVIFALFACVGLLVANFNRRGQGKVILLSILAMIAVQILDMTFTNMAKRNNVMIFLMYANCFLPLFAAFGLLIKSPVFKRRKTQGDAI